MNNPGIPLLDPFVILKRVVCKYYAYRILPLLWCLAYGQMDTAKSGLPESECCPKIVLSFDHAAAVTVCLDRFEAGGDSCTDFTLRLHTPYRIDMRFTCTFDHRWLFDTMVSVDPNIRIPPMRADVATDSAGNLLEMRLFFAAAANDSSKVPFNIQRNGDIPEALPDTAPPPVEYVLQKKAFVCVERAVYGITVYRTFTYPPGYMRREPVYNYPELKMFHCGGAVRIPTAHSIRMRGYYINEEKILHPPALKYEEPAKYIDDGRSKKAAPEKKGFFTIRPLR